MDINNALTVSEINELIKTILTENIDQKIFVQGEISNIKRSNGNLYFSLKDTNSLISIVCWRPKFSNFDNGDNVTISGKLTCFTKQGTYQLNATSIDKNGMGDLHKKYDKLKEYLGNKSYFSKKRDFPQKINRVAILTAAEGAALQDIMYVLKTNNYAGEILIKNCLVQGSGCPASVKEGIEYFNELNTKLPIDVLIVARGGGSVEDLMGYSTEEVVRAIYMSDIFTISAIGHEIDTMLSDLAADFRAPTPSIAGETIIKEQKKKFAFINEYLEKVERIKYTIDNKICNFENKLLNLQSIHKSFSLENVINNEINRLKNISESLQNKILLNFNSHVYELEKLKNKNNMYNATRILKSGYTLVIDNDGDLIETVDQFKKYRKSKEKIRLVFVDGEIEL